MGSLGIVCLVCLRRLQPHVGVCVTAGAVAVFLKVFTLGGLYPGPLIGIAAEAILVEVAFLLAGQTAAASILAGALALAVNPMQKVLMTLVVAGPEAVQATVELAQTASLRVGGPSFSAWDLLGVLVVFHGLVGAAAGAVAWSLAGRVEKRLGRAA